MHTMRIGLLIISILMISGSCCKVYCPRELMAIRMIGFDPADLDTIVIRKYEAADFTSLIDSTVTRTSTSPMDTFYFDYFDSEGFQFSKNYEVFFPGIPRTYKISDLQIRREECNCGQQDGKRVDGYTLDDQASGNDEIYIHK